MIKHIASCPYCRRGEIAFDCEIMDLVINPDGGDQRPCEHLLCLYGFFTRARVLPDMTRQAGYARVHWQHADLDALHPDEVYRRLNEQGAGAGSRQVPGGEEPVQVGPVRMEAAEYLTPAETARWFDQVGWDKAERVDVPYTECRLEAWAGFARHPTQLLPLLSAGCP
jgi:hypothetical protein